MEKNHVKTAVRLSPASLHNYCVKMFLAVLGLHTALYLCNYTSIAAFCRQMIGSKAILQQLKMQGVLQPTNHKNFELNEKRKRKT